MAVVTITADNFDEMVLQSEKTVLLDFWASWCGPCKMLSPIVDQIGEELSGQVVVGKINVDEERELAKRFQVMSIPTLLVFKDGKMTERSVGVQAKEDILELVK